jgi:hypothetical protein
MPKWGLTESHRRAQPWGFSSSTSSRGKSSPIRYMATYSLRSLKFASWIPSRFSGCAGSINWATRTSSTRGRLTLVFHTPSGAVRVAQDFMDSVLDQQNDPPHERGLFQEWKEEVAQVYKHETTASKKPGDGDEPIRVLRQAFHDMDRRIGEAIVAARLEPCSTTCATCPTDTRSKTMSSLAEAPRRAAARRIRSRASDSAPPRRGSVQAP